jgi:hypothetical protein
VGEPHSVENASPMKLEKMSPTHFRSDFPLACAKRPTCGPITVEPTSWLRLREELKAD